MLMPAFGGQWRILLCRYRKEPLMADWPPIIAGLARSLASGAGYISGLLK
jgi:hypothetical protein